MKSIAWLFGFGARAVGFPGAGGEATARCTVPPSVRPMSPGRPSPLLLMPNVSGVAGLQASPFERVTFGAGAVNGSPERQATGWGASFDEATAQEKNCGW